MSVNTVNSLFLPLIPEQILEKEALLIEVDRQVLPSHNELMHYLTASEKKQFSSVKYAQARDRMIVSRAMLRILLGYYLSCSPEAVAMATGSYGKPELKDQVLFFNVSHTKHKYMYLLARSVPVGVDTEYINPRKQWHDIARDYFHPDEYAFLLKSVGDPDAIRQFYSIWVGKEAVMKFSGFGMSLPINSFCIYPDKELQTVYYEFKKKLYCCALRLMERRDQFKCAIATPEGEKIKINHIIINE